MLKIIDNPRQDIPLAGILRSSIGGISSEELAYLKAFCPEKDMLDAVMKNILSVTVHKQEYFLPRKHLISPL